MLCKKRLNYLSRSVERHFDRIKITAQVGNEALISHLIRKHKSNNKKTLNFQYFAALRGHSIIFINIKLYA
jgi:hypothetical protein